MSFLDHIRVCNAHDLAHFRPFVLGGRRMGWVKPAFMRHLAAFPDVFAVRDDLVALSERLHDPRQRTAAVRRVIDELAAEKLVRGPRGEDYAVLGAWGEAPAMLLDRAAVPLFGVRAFGLHVNGFVRDGERLKLWIGRRALDKSVAPGKLDNLVAGGQPAGPSLAENLRKEAREEADLPDWLIARAKPVGAIGYVMETEAGLKPDTMFCYDLELPADFVPRNTDGEIADFRLMPVEEAAALIQEGDAFKFNVNLVITDFLIRHGCLDPDSEPDYLEIVAGLRRRV